MKRLLGLFAVLGLCAGAHAQCIALGGHVLTANDAPVCLTTASDPFELPLLNSGQVSSLFTFLGSVKIPVGAQGFSYGVGALSVSGATLNMSGTAYDQNDTNQYTYGIGSIELPTLTGTPDYIGGNATATVTNIPAVPGTYVASANYTFTATPVTGNTSGTLTSLPPGIAANDGWYINFGSTSESMTYLVTAISGDTVTWSTALPTGTYTSTVPIHQWLPSSPFGAASGYRITGSAVNGSTLYVTGGTYYDGSCDKQLGWIAGAPPATPGAGWGAVNTVSGIPGTSPQNSRYLAGPMGNVPSIWQPYFGPMYQTGAHALSIDSCYIPAGFTFLEFNPEDVSNGGGAVPVTSALAYYYQGLFTSAYPEQLSGRVLTGPFPLTTTTGYYPATLAAAPAQGAATASFALPSSTVTVTANVTSGSNSLVITAVTSGTISNSGIEYSVSDASGSLGDLQPAYDYAPGTSLGAATYNLTVPPTETVTGDTVTLTPIGYLSDYYTICFSDSECRLAHLQGGTYGSPQSAIPYPSAGSTDPAYLVDSPTAYYGLTAVPSSGATEATFTSLPSGMAANDNWYVTFYIPPAFGNSPTASNYSTVLVTGISGNTISWSGGLSGSGYGTMVAVYQAAPLTGSGLTTAVTVAPMGDAFLSEYDNAYGYGFIVPGTRTFAVIVAHNYGPNRGRGPYNECSESASGSNEIPLAPDTSPYISLTLDLYDLQQLYDAVQGLQPTYQVTPYASVPFPNQAPLFSSSGCFEVASGFGGWATFDYVHDILYLAPTTSAGGNGDQTVLYEYQLTPP